MPPDVHSPPPSAAEDCCDQLIADFLRAEESGSRPDPAEWAARRPQCAEALRGFLADRSSVVALEVSAPTAPPGSGTATPPSRWGNPLPHDSPVRSVAISPDGATLCTGTYDGRVRLWDAVTRNPVGGPAGHEPGTMVRYIAFSPRGDTVLTAGYDRTARLWDARTGRLLRTFPHNAEVQTVAFAPDGSGTALTSSSDKAARMWNLSDDGAAALGEMRHHHEVHSLAFSPAPGATLLVTGGGRAVQLWDRRTHYPVGTAMLHGDQVESVRFSPDGTRVVSGSYDRAVRVWDAATQTPIGEAMRHQDQVHAVRFVRDDLVLSGSLDGTARLWSVRPATADRPAPTADAGHLKLWLAVHTGLELDAEDRVVELDRDAWRDRYRRLMERGGLELP